MKKENEIWPLTRFNMNLYVYVKYLYEPNPLRDTASESLNMA